VSGPGHTGITAFGLTPPERLLVPKFHCAGRPHDQRVLTLGYGEDAPTITRHDYGRCKNGCCEASAMVVLSVPCGNLPHCNACECGSEHDFTLGDGEIRRLKELLP
jgi:hypothetical protein